MPRLSKKLRETKPPESWESRVHTSPMSGEKFWMVLWDKHRRVWRRWDPEKMLGVPMKEYRKAVSLGDVNHFADGSFKYQTHGRRDKGWQPCIEDMACPEAARDWPDYVVTKDSDGNMIQGPAPFRNSDEKREYQRRFGFRDADRGERFREPRELIREGVREMFRGMR